MTDRLQGLLHLEAAELEVPQAPTAAVLTRGRALRRRRRVGTGFAAAAALAVVGGGAVAGAQLLPERGATMMTPSAEHTSGGAFAVGAHVHYDGTDASSELDEKVKVLYYTSAGVVVRTGSTESTDSAGPSHYHLVTPQGDVRRLDLDLRDRVPGTDPGQPYLAWAEVTDAGWEIVVRDVRTDEEQARIPVTGSFTWGGWAAPPVALADDTVYVGLDDEVATVDWRTGRVGTADELTGSAAPEVAGARGVVYDRVADEVRVVDVASGATLLTVPGTDLPFVALSPNGRYATVVRQLQEESPGEDAGFTVHDLDTGESAEVAGPTWESGWTPDDRLLRVSSFEVTSCEPISGECETEQVDLGEGPIRLAGNAYEA